MTVGNRSKRTPDSYDSPVEASVRQTIQKLLPTHPSLAAVAARLSINVRTLQRRLAESGTSFRLLLDDCRRQRAEEALRQGELSVTEVSRQLGYSDPAHFVRAFRRWNGYPPTRFCVRAGRRVG